MRHRTGSLKVGLAGYALALLLILVAGVAISAYIAHERSLSLPSRIEVTPRDAAVFAGGAIAFSARLIGGRANTPVEWSVVGPGSISQSGVYNAPERAGEGAVVVARAGAVSQAVNVKVSSPPREPLLLIACYEANLVDVRELPSTLRSGAVLSPELAAGIAVDPARRVALVAAKERVMALDLTSMKTFQSDAVHGARFSGAAELAGGYFAVTDNLGARGSAGIDFFRIEADGRPVFTGSIDAGETPEGIVAQSGGRIFYVTNVNSNELLRYSFDGRGNARITGRAVTGTRPFGIALDETRRLLFVTDNDTPFLSGKRAQPGLEVFSLTTLRHVRPTQRTGTRNALPIGAAVDNAVGRLFVTNEGDANIAVFDLPSVKRIATLQAGRFPWTPRVDQDAHRLYVPSARDDRVDVFDTRSLRAIAPSISTCAYPTNVMFAARRSP